MLRVRVSGDGNEESRPQRSQRETGNDEATNPPFREGFEDAAGGRSSDSGLPPHRLPGLESSGVMAGSVSPYSGGTVPDLHRSSLTVSPFD